MDGDIKGDSIELNTSSINPGGGGGAKEHPKRRREQSTVKAIVVAASSSCFVSASAGTVDSIVGSAWELPSWGQGAPNRVFNTPRMVVQILDGKSPRGPEREFPVRV